MTEDPKTERLTDEDLDVLSGMMIIFAHSMERIVGIIELAYEDRYRQGKQYKELCKTVGKVRADEIAHAGIQRMYRQDENYQIGRILKVSKDLHRMMEVLNMRARNAHSENTTEWETFDAIIHDVNLLCYMYGLIGNCNGDDDGLKLLSFLKVLAKGKRVSPRVLERLREQVDAQGK